MILYKPKTTIKRKEKLKQLLENIKQVKKDGPYPDDDYSSISSVFDGMAHYYRRNIYFSVNTDINLLTSFIENFEIINNNERPDFRSYYVRDNICRIFKDKKL